MEAVPYGSKSRYRVALVGATGLVGGHALRELAAASDVTTTLLVRRPWSGRTLPNHVQTELFAFDDPAAYSRLGRAIPCDALICCIGTTLRKAGSAAAFKAVDSGIPVALLASLAGSGTVFGLVSSVGADRPRGLYLQTKAAAEQALFASGLPGVIVRPSLLLGARDELRIAERVGTVAAPALFAVLRPLVRVLPRLADYAPVEAAVVAKALVRATLAMLREGAVQGSVHIMEGSELMDLGGTAPRTHAPEGTGSVGREEPDRT